MSLAIELALDRIEAAIAAELPAHVTAFARAHAAGTPAPPAPPALADPTTLATAERALAARDPGLERRGRSLWRQCALLAIENDREVARRRTAGGGWPELAALATARDTAARVRWGRGFLAVAHDVFEVPPGDVDVDVDGNVNVDATVDVDVNDNDNDNVNVNVKVQVSVDVNVNPVNPITELSIRKAWTRLTDLPPPEIVIADARPRTFAVRRGAAIVVVPRAATATAWSQALHELGHAWVAIAGRDLPRTLDEAVAITAARTLEATQPSARDIHARQRQIAIQLAEIERALYPGHPTDLARARAALAEARGPRPEAPPWALWHDPGAQAAYVAAEAAAWRVDRLDELRSRLP